MNWLRMMSEILQQNVGILANKKKECMKNETQTVRKRKPGSYLICLETHDDNVLCCYRTEI